MDGWWKPSNLKAWKSEATDATDVPQEPRPDTPASSDVSAPSAGGHRTEQHDLMTKWEPHPPEVTFKPWWMTNIFGGKNWSSGKRLCFHGSEMAESVTPPKFNMEPENVGLKKESPFPETSFQVPC